MRPHSNAPQHPAFTASIKNIYRLNGIPTPSKTLVFTTDDSEAADNIAAHFGGVPQQHDDGRGFLVVSTHTSLTLLLHNINDVNARLIIHGAPQGTAAVGDWRLRAREKEAAPSPEITFAVSLQAAPTLGRFRYRSASWALLREITQIREKAQAQLQEKGAPIALVLTLQKETITHQGRAVQFTRPVIELGD